jgi:hypothetical protein
MYTIYSHTGQPRQQLSTALVVPTRDDTVHKPNTVQYVWPLMLTTDELRGVGLYLVYGAVHGLCLTLRVLSCQQWLLPATLLMDLLAQAPERLCSLWEHISIEYNS